MLTNLLSSHTSSQRQARRICEILRLYNTDENSEKELSKYYTLIRTRIASPFTVIFDVVVSTSMHSFKAIVKMVTIY